METRAVSKYNSISASKARLVADVIRGYSFPEAVDALKSIQRNMQRKASYLILNTLYSAGANAKYKNPNINESSLYIKKVTIDVGPSLRRFRARARGRASRIRKRTSTITVILSDES
jgi:large subunit ribosomal protein L22